MNDKYLKKEAKKLAEFLGVEYKEHINYIFLTLKSVYYRGKVDGIDQLEKKLFKK